MVRLQTASIQNTPTSKGIKAFIFDLDGVLVDTAEYHYRAWKCLADDEGLPFDRKANEALRGISRGESLMMILNGRSLPEDKIQEMMERKNRYYLEFVQEVTSGDLLPGARELLLEVRAAGMKSAIGSASKNTGQVLRNWVFLPLFDAISDGYSVENPKPAPDLFLHAADQLGCTAAGMRGGGGCCGWHSRLPGQVVSARSGWDLQERVGAADLVFPVARGGASGADFGRARISDLEKWRAFTRQILNSELYE